MGWNFRKKKSVMSNLTEEQKKRLEEEAKKVASAFKVIQIAEDPISGNLSVNVVQNVRSQIEVMGIIFKALKLIECEFNKSQQQSRIVTR